MIDFRSDTVTRPTPAMLAAMANAELGDDVYGDDPTVNRLEQLAAELLGKQAAILAPSGTQSNLLALLSQCQRGDEYLVGADAHTYKYEGGGAAVLGSIQPQTIPFGENGVIDLDRAAAVIKPVDPHFARTRLLALENTQYGRVLPLDYLDQAGEFARQHGLLLHLDGARMMNAAVYCGVSAERIARPFDSVSLCLSKGLCAPIGSLLCGSRELIDEARHWRKMLGGGMRQAGIIAAAGIVALTDMVDRLAEDHANAELLAEQLSSIEQVEVRQGWTQTNMVWVKFLQPAGAGLSEFAQKRGFKLSINTDDSSRLVTHKDISAADIDGFIGMLKTWFKAAH